MDAVLVRSFPVAMGVQSIGDRTGKRRHVSHDAVFNQLGRWAFGPIHQFVHDFPVRGVPADQQDPIRVAHKLLICIKLVWIVNRRIVTPPPQPLCRRWISCRTNPRRRISTMLPSFKIARPYPA